MKPSNDSIFEDSIESRMISLGFIRCNAFFMQDGSKRKFWDKLKRSFHAKIDWWHVKLKISAESKCHVLNAKTTQDAAANGLSRQQAYRAGRGETGNVKLERFDRLNNQWPHSQVKQSIVQTALTPYEQVVFFKDPPTFEEMFTYTSKGLFAVPMSALSGYLLHLRLRQE